ncbi:MAG: response regulator, partial [Rubrivivax sp.]
MGGAEFRGEERWPRAAVLVVDDEPGMRHFIDKALAPRVGRVHVASTAEEAEALLLQHHVDLVVLDIALPGKNGIALLNDMRAQGIAAEVVLITAFADLKTAIEALRAGAGDMLLKPFRVTQLLGAVRHGLDRAQLRRENWVLRRELSQRTPPADGLVGTSIAIKGLQAALHRVAGVDSTVLLTGESGTGKELAALALHRLSPHAGAPFVPVNCATATPATLEAELFGHHGGEGLFVAAQGGTLFLDEVG